MSKRVTDLEKFALEEIYRPYQTLLGFEERLTALPYSLEQTAELLSIKSYWTDCVVSRLHGIGITFAKYIEHPLVDVLREAIAKYEATP